MIPLTAREKEALLLAGEGYSNRGIAKIMVVSSDTVRLHLASVRCKAGLDKDPRMNGRVLLARLADRVKADEKSELAGLRWLGKVAG